MDKSTIIGFSALHVLIVLLALVFLAVATCYVLRREVALSNRYTKNFVGMPEQDVIAEIGEPSYDGRTAWDYTPGSPYTLGWNYGFGNRLGLVVNDGKVVEQWHGSR